MSLNVISDRGGGTSRLLCRSAVPRPPSTRRQHMLRDWPTELDRTLATVELLADQHQCWIVLVSRRDEALFPFEFDGFMVLAALD